MLRSLTSFFFLTVTIVCINRPVRGPQKSAFKVVVILVVRLYGIRAG